ncbi:Mu transposase C-terminal domain-containing protein [Lactococcus garvieae]|uniref:Mu transposase C-terminal domain-containing protein n=1 Tax=Lactococcus garvieae TaxID=1363 RepID=UPI00398F2331
MKRQALINFSEYQRDDAMRKYKIIEPYLTHQVGIKEISLKSAIPQRTLYRWVKSFEREGLIGLVRKTRSDFEQIKVSPKIRKMIEDLVLRYKKISTKTLYRKIVVDCKENKTRIPNYSQIYKLRKSIPNSLIQLAHEGDKKYKETYDLITIREASRPNEIWQADHTLLDIHLIDENGKINRPWLTIILDDYSRAVAGYYLSFSAPSAMNTALTLHQAIWTKKDASWDICGIPENFYTDHGSDFTSNFMEQVAVDLKMNLIFSTIGVPRGRGKIERFFQTINQMLLESLPGYTKNKNEERLLNLQDFKEKLHSFLIHEYNQSTHSSIKIAPIKKWNEKLFLPHMPNSLEELDLLLLEIPKSRKIHSDGIHFQGLRYTNINLSAFVGESILIRYTPNDLAEIRVFYKNKFLCTAISPEISDYEINMHDLVSARNKRKTLLKQKVNAPSSLELLVEDKRSEKIVPTTKNSSLKRYYNE